MDINIGDVLMEGRNVEEWKRGLRADVEDAKALSVQMLWEITQDFSATQQHN